MQGIFEELFAQLLLMLHLACLVSGEWALLPMEDSLVTCPAAGWRIPLL